jgi:hypothetical protein
MVTAEAEHAKEPRKNMSNCPPMKATEQARRIVDLWQERPRWQRTAEHLLPFYGWLSEHEPAVIPSGQGSILKVSTILAHLLYGANQASTPGAFDHPSATAAASPQTPPVSCQSPSVGGE